MEISGWSGQAIYIQDPMKLISAFDDVKCTTTSSITTSTGRERLRRRNARTARWLPSSATSSTSTATRSPRAASPASAIGADKNLVLKGGGHHDTFFNEWTHQFDVHGDDNCCDIIPFYEERWWNCGNAGDAFEYIDNTFQFTNDLAIKIRGTPRIGADIDHNVFAHDDLDDASRRRRARPDDNSRHGLQQHDRRRSLRRVRRLRLRRRRPGRPVPGDRRDVVVLERGTAGVALPQRASRDG